MVDVKLLQSVARLSRFVDFRYKTVDKGLPITSFNNNTLYIHIPFCKNLCNYCFFHKFKYQEDTIKLYYKYLLKEIELLAEKGFTISDVYIGGGTPTLYIDGIVSLINKLKKYNNISSISIESDPYTLNNQMLQRLKENGVDRLSVGIQSFDQNITQNLGRKGSTSTDDLIDILIDASHKIKTFNLDLLFNLPGQDIYDIEKELNYIKIINPHQVTYYPLMNHTIKLFDEFKTNKKEKSLYEYIKYSLQKHYIMSSVWSYTKKNINLVDEYISETPSFICAGCGSFGYINGILYANSFNLKKYFNLIESNDLPYVAYKKLNTFQEIMYLLTLKLYKTKFNKNSFLDDCKNISERYQSISKIYPSILLEFLKKIKILREFENNYLTLTNKGYYFTLNLMKHFYININTLRKFCIDNYL
ncbi:MAG: radical SAM protein [Deferribacterota bacterium]|nr:radical SAM protein [Deferribacterota bacterium]